LSGNGRYRSESDLPVTRFSYLLSPTAGGFPVTCGFLFYLFMQKNGATYYGARKYLLAQLVRYI
jgi:hypothetical protein